MASSRSWAAVEAAERGLLEPPEPSWAAPAEGRSGAMVATAAEEGRGAEGADAGAEGMRKQGIGQQGRGPRCN
jgi:hypothetical protein